MSAESASERSIHFQDKTILLADDDMRQRSLIPTMAYTGSADFFVALVESKSDLPIWPDSGIFFSFIPMYAHAHARSQPLTKRKRPAARAARFTRVLNYTRLRDTGTEGVPPRLGRNWGGGLGPGPRVSCREPRGCSSCLVGGIEIKIESLYTRERWRQMVVTLRRWILPRAEYLRRGVSRFNISYCAGSETSRPLVMKTHVYVTPGYLVMSRYIIRAYGGARPN